MRPVQLLFGSLVIGTLTACGSAAPPAGTQSSGATATPVAAPSVAATPAATPSAASTQPAASTPPVVITPPPQTIPVPSVPAPGGTSTISYQITGEYEASGEAAFDEEGSNYTEEGYLDIFREGWTAYFENEAANHTIRLVTRPDDHVVEFFGGDVVVRADGRSGSDDECTFTITKNDASGPVGSAVCERAVLHPNGSTYVNLSIEWEVNL